MKDVRPDSVILRVQKAKKRDIGRNIIRIDPKTMEQLNIQTGDVIALFGKKESAGIAMSSYPQDNGLGIIRIDSRLRKNTGTSIDDPIEVRKIKALAAQSIVLAPSSIKIRSNPRFESFIKRKLNNYPVSLNDYINIFIGITREITFKVINIRPEGICIIKPETQLHISEHITDEEEKGAEYVTYEDIGGLKKEIDEVRTILDIKLKLPLIRKKLNMDIPKGILFVGPSGTGKTLLARVIANESEAHFISINGSEIISKFYGESEKKLRNIFEEAEEKSPSIIFIDHIDSLAPKITKKMMEKSMFVEHRVVNQLLGLMDGLHISRSVIVIGATNKSELIEAALFRPGRFDKIIYFSFPDVTSRIEIYKIYTRDLPLEDNISTEELAKKSENFSGADIKGVCQLASFNAFKRQFPNINQPEDVNEDLTEKISISNNDFLNAITEISERIKILEK